MCQIYQFSTYNITRNDVPRLTQPSPLKKNSLPPSCFAMSDDQFASFAKLFCDANLAFTPDVVVPFLKFAHENDLDLFRRLCTSMVCSIHGISLPQPPSFTPTSPIVAPEPPKTASPTSTSSVIVAEPPKKSTTPLQQYIEYLKTQLGHAIKCDESVDSSRSPCQKYIYIPSERRFEYPFAPASVDVDATEVERVHKYLLISMPSGPVTSYIEFCRANELTFSDGRMRPDLDTTDKTDILNAAVSYAGQKLVHEVAKFVNWELNEQNSKL